MTMKAKDLRIGNYYLNFNNRVEQIKSGTAIDNLCKFKNECTPIPITEEWLVKLGFDIDGVGWYINNTNPFFKEYNLHYESSVNGWDKGFITHDFLGQMNGIKYVHQLQNLYFALTNNEL